MTTGLDGASRCGEPSISQQIAQFAATATLADIPAAAIERAKLLVLDAVGVALAASTFDFARRIADVTASTAPGNQPIIGLAHRLGARDAAFVNGMLVHGLDFDDTHVGGVVHASASTLPAAFAMVGQHHASGAELLVGYVLGIEVAARVGKAAAGGMHRVGFHPTGVAGTFGAAICAGRLQGLSAARLADAQGIALSFASGSMQFAEEGAETKRLHAGWAAAAGITAAALAGHAGAAPQHAYEGGHGLFRSHLATDDRPELALLTAGLGERWEIDDVAVKLHPSCHFTHAFIEAATALATAHDLRADDIMRVVCPIHPDEVPVICEPRERKVAPASDYEAKFSLPFTVAAALIRRRFTLDELRPEMLCDPAVLALARRVEHADDPDSDYPRAYPGEVVVHTTDGRALRRRVSVNLGGRERPVPAADIVEKFRVNAAFADVDARAAARIHDEVMNLEACAAADGLVELLSGVAGTTNGTTVLHVAR